MSEQERERAREKESEGESEGERARGEMKTCGQREECVSALVFAQRCSHHENKSDKF